jgi:hypothetical protein
MSSEQGFFESDDDFRERLERESNEKIIENSTGFSPSQSMFESDEAYSDRISSESNEAIIMSNVGNAPSQRMFESDGEYHARIEQEANESIIESATGNSPSQSMFESDENYNTRVRKEANEHYISESAGDLPQKGLFEGDYEFRQRINHEANIARVDRIAKEINVVSDKEVGLPGKNRGSRTSNALSSIAKNTEGFFQLAAHFVLSVGLLLGSIWLIQNVEELSLLWWLSLFVGIGAGIHALAFAWVLFVVFAFVGVVSTLIGYFFSNPW